MDHPIGHTIRGYHFRSQLGRGGCGIVYLAHQKTLSRDVAIKFLLPEFANNPDFVESFDSEAKLVARLEHAHIVPIYDYWHDEENAAIVMRCLTGGNLREVLTLGGKLSLDRVSSVIDQISSALATAHKSGIVHRDLKPENILFDENDTAYLTDFGIAMPSGASTAGNVFTGTLAYAAPEQLQGFPPTPQMDVYSFGIIIYEMLVGRHPAQNMALHELVFWHFNDPVPQISELPKERLEQINEIIQRATEKDPDKRYRDPYEIAIDFRQAMALDIYEAETQRAKLSVIEPERKAIVEHHLDYLYQRLDGLYENLHTTHGEKTDQDIKARIQQLQLEVNYRNNGLKALEQNARFIPPAALQLPSEPAHTLVGIQEMSQTFKAALIGGKSFTLLGPSGIGKSEFAAALARDEAVQTHFNGRVLWMQLGKNPDLFLFIGEWLQALGVSQDDLSQLTTLEDRKKRLQALVGMQPTLVVADDVWKADEIKQALLDSRNKLVYIITTLSADVAAAFSWDFHKVETLDIENRVRLVGSIVPPILKNQDVVRRLVERLGGFPRDLILLAMRLRKAGSSTSRLQREIDRIKISEILAQGYESLALTIEELSEGARKALGALAVLPPEPNTFSEAAGEIICEDLAYVDELVDYSLLKVDASGDRYALHPSFAEYARTYLLPEAAVFERVVDYTLQYAIDHAADFAALALEQRSFENALSLAQEHRLTDLVPAAAAALAPYWEGRGMLEQAERFITSGLEASSHPQQQAQLYLAFARLDEKRGNLEQSAAHLAQALTLADGQDTAFVLALTVEQAQIKNLQSDFEEAKALYHQALEQAQQQRNLMAVSEIYSSLGAIEVYDMGNPDGAKDYFLKSLEAARRVNDPYRISTALRNLGLLETQFFRELAQAKTYLVEALEIARALNHAEQISAVLQARGMLEMAHNRIEQSALYYEEALQKARISNSVEALAFSLLTLANAIVLLDQFSKAEEYLAESLKYAQMLDSDVVVAFIVDVLTKTGETRIARQQIGFNQAVWDTVAESAKAYKVDEAKLAWLDDTRKRLRENGHYNVFIAQSRAQLKLGLIEGDGFHDYEQAKYHLKESLKLAGEVEDTELMVSALNELSHAYIELADFASAEATLRTSIELAHSQPQLLDNALRRVLELGNARLQTHQYEIDERLWTTTLEAARETIHHAPLSEVVDQLRRGENLFPAP